MNIGLNHSYIGCMSLLLLVLLWLPDTALAAGGRVDASSASLGQMLMNLQQSLMGVWTMLTGACWLLGTTLFVLGVMKLKKYGQMTVFMMAQADFVGPMMRIFVGTLLIYTPWSIEMLLNTAWSGGVTMNTSMQTGNLQGYISSGDMSFESLMGPVFSLVQIIGLVAFIRGLVKLAKVGEQGGQPGTVPAAMMLLFGGVFAINIVGTIDVLEATLLGAT